MNLSRLIGLAAAAGCIAIALWVPTSVRAAASDSAALLQQADSVKSSDHARFVQLLRRLDADPTALSQTQKDQLHYFHGWESTYQNDSDGAIKALRAVAAHAIDPNLRLRATGTLINVLANATRYEEAYALQNGLIAALPGVRDRQTRLRILSNAALLYASAGQTDLALDYANQLLAGADGDFTACQAQYYRILAFSKTPDHNLQTNFPAALARCVKAKEPIWADSIRVLAVERELDQGHPEAAEAALEPYLAEVRKTGFSDLLVEMEASLGRAAWMQGNKISARTYALQVTDAHTNTAALLFAYRVLYEIAKSEGDSAAALNWYEKYAGTDKGYLNDISARSLAYQMVSQQVASKKLQIDALNKQNLVLTLQQQVGRKSAETRGLYIALLLVLLGSLIFWGYRTKRSQIRFRQLARRDGLTGIFNRQHFIDVAEDALKHCGKSGRDASVIVIDLDNFKLVNDAHGHAAGDLVLRRAVDAFSSRLRSIDIFGRLGGEEFGIVLPDCGLDQAQALAETLRKAISSLQHNEAGPDFPVSASFGIAATQTSGYDLRQLMAHADNALYQAKREGRNRVETFVAGTELPEDQRAGQLDRRRK